MIRRALLGRRIDLPLGLLALGILANPFYVLRSGLPQPGDFVIMAAVAMLLAGSRFRLQIPRAVQVPAFLVTAFAAWVTLVSLTWALLLGDARVAIAFLFITYNVSAFLTVLSLPARYGPGVTSTVGLFYAAAVILVTALVPVFYEPWMYRQEFMFNNPNQVGYFAVFSTSCYAVVPGRTRFPVWLDALVLGGAAILVVMSASRAAFFGLVPLAFFIARSRGATGSLAIGGLVAAALVGLLYLSGPALTPGLEGPDMASRTNRLTDVEAGAGMERGYERILDYPEYTLLGAGEGGLQRFNVGAFDLEIHSTPGTLLFSYGIVGLSLMAGVLLWLVRRGGWSSLLWIAPPVLVGITHNTLRQTDLWVFLALAVLRVAPSAPPTRHAVSVRGGSDPRSSIPRMAPSSR